MTGAAVLLLVVIALVVGGWLGRRVTQTGYALHEMWAIWRRRHRRRH